MSACPHCDARPGRTRRTPAGACHATCRISAPHPALRSSEAPKVRRSEGRGSPKALRRSRIRRVTVRSARYPALRQSGAKIVEPRADPGPGAVPAQGHRPVVAVDNASVRLARSRVHTGFTARLPPKGKRSVEPVSERCGSLASIVEQRADPVRARLPAEGHRPLLAVDNASVRSARSHVHTETTERLPPKVAWAVRRFPDQKKGYNKGAVGAWNL